MIPAVPQPPLLSSAHATAWSSSIACSEARAQQVSRLLSVTHGVEIEGMVLVAWFEDVGLDPSARDR